MTIALLVFASIDCHTDVGFTSGKDVGIDCQSEGEFANGEKIGEEELDQLDCTEPRESSPFVEGKNPPVS